MAQGNIRGCFPRHIRGWDNIRGQDTAPGERRDELSLAMWEPSRWFAGNLGFSWDVSVLCLEIMERKERGPALPRSTWRGWMGSSGSIRNQDQTELRIQQESRSSRNQDPGFVTREKPSMGMELQESPVGLSHSSGKGLRRIWAPLAPPPAWISLDPWKFAAHGPG